MYASQLNYHAFLRIVRQWRSMITLKRAGRIDLKEMCDGELVVPCVVCPKPHVNLPEGWEKHPHA